MRAQCVYNGLGGEMDWEKIKNNLPKKMWEKLSYYEKYSYLKTFIVAYKDARYLNNLKSLDKFLSVH